MEQTSDRARCQTLDSGIDRTGCGLDVGVSLHVLLRTIAPKKRSIAKPRSWVLPNPPRTQQFRDARSFVVLQYRVVPFSCADDARACPLSSSFDMRRRRNPRRRQGFDQTNWKALLHGTGVAHDLWMLHILPFLAFLEKAHLRMLQTP